MDPTERYLNCVFKEYDSLRGEVVQRSSAHHAFLAWSIVVGGGIAWLGLDGWGTWRADLAWMILLPLWALVSYVVVEVGWTHTERLGNHIAWLEVKICAIVSLPSDGLPRLDTAAKQEATRYVGTPNLDQPNLLLYPVGWETWIRRQGKSHVGASTSIRLGAMVAVPLIVGLPGDVMFTTSGQWLMDPMPFPGLFHVGLGVVACIAFYRWRTGLLALSSTSTIRTMLLVRRPDAADPAPVDGGAAAIGSANPPSSG